MTTDLILSSDFLTGVMDRGYLEQEDDPHFPVRLSGLGDCPRATRVLIGDGSKRRPYTPRSMRVFEQGRQRGNALAEAWSTGFWLWCAEQKIDKARFTIRLEEEGWLATNIRGDLARKVRGKACEWVAENAERGIDLNDAWIPFKVEDDVLYIRGRMDLLLIDNELKRFWVFDFKTKNSWGFKKLDEEGIGESYQVQVLAYVRTLMDTLEDFTWAGGWVFYEDHDKRTHKPLECNAHWGILEGATTNVEHLLRNWAQDGPESEAPALCAQKDRWTKKRHVAALGCLPWQCNYCSVGPEVGKCMQEGTYVEDISKPEDDVPKYEVYAGASEVPA